MAQLFITREFRFEGAHALTGYDGKCRHIHGHSYKLLVTITGEPSEIPGHPKSGMIMDFNDLKNIVHQYVIDPLDHSLMLREEAPLSRELKEQYDNINIFWSRSFLLPTGCTAYACMKLQPLLPNGSDETYIYDRRARSGFSGVLCFYQPPHDQFKRSG